LLRSKERKKTLSGKEREKLATKNTSHQKPKVSELSFLSGGAGVSPAPSVHLVASFLFFGSVSVLLHRNKRTEMNIKRLIGIANGNYR
jgi:hypothetical protein